MGFFHERNRPPPRPGVFLWLRAWAFGRKGVRCFPAGHKLLRMVRDIEPTARYQPRRLVDYSYVIHDLQLNAWILAYRQHLQRALIDWHGETPIHPGPTAQLAQLAAADAWTAGGLKDPAARPVFPDAVLEIKRREGPHPWTLLLEHDRTRRVDKNYDKFRRYDHYLVSWHHQAGFARPGDDEPAPYVLFICQDQDQRQLFMQAADHELSGYRWHSITPHERDYRGRQRILFAVELDIHQGVLDAARLPVLPPGHPDRTDENSRVHRVRLPGPPIAARAQERPPDPSVPVAEPITAVPAPGWAA